MKTTITQTLVFSKDCKNSVRFDAPKDSVKPALTAVYVSHDHIDATAAEIEVTIVVTKEQVPPGLELPADNVQAAATAAAAAS